MAVDSSGNGARPDAIAALTSVATAGGLIAATSLLMCLSVAASVNQVCGLLPSVFIGWKAAVSSLEMACILVCHCLGVSVDPLALPPLVPEDPDDPPHPAIASAPMVSTRAGA